MIVSIIHTLNSKRKRLVHRCFDVALSNAVAVFEKISPLYKYLTKGTVKFVARQVSNIAGNKYSNNTIYKLVKEELEARLMPPNVLINKKEKDPLIYEASLIAKDVYTIFKANLVGGWHLSDISIEGVEYQDNTGLVSALYERTKDNGETQYVYALAGTGPISYQDYKADVMQALAGKAEQYESALRNARLIAAHLSGKELMFIGHSLGGSEAAYCANNIPNSKAITFNPSGIKGAVKGQSNVSAYILMDDPLNLIQDIGLGLIPQADGIKHYVDYDSKYFSHDINAVVEAMKHYFC